MVVVLTPAQTGLPTLEAFYPSVNVSYSVKKERLYSCAEALLCPMIKT